MILAGSTIDAAFWWAIIAGAAGVGVLCLGTPYWKKAAKWVAKRVYKNIKVRD